MSDINENAVDRAVALGPKALSKYEVGDREMLQECDIELDLHGYHPDEICGEPLAKIMRTAWEAGAASIRLIHGHGRNRGISPGFVNTNTGNFGLRIRDALRHDFGLRQWIKHTTLDCSHEGSTVIKLKRNANPTQPEPDWDQVLPARKWF